jgi:hypothetical protein
MLVKWISSCTRNANLCCSWWSFTSMAVNRSVVGLSAMCSQIVSVVDRWRNYSAAKSCTDLPDNVLEQRADCPSLIRIKHGRSTDSENYVKLAIEKPSRISLSEMTTLLHACVPGAGEHHNHHKPCKQAIVHKNCSISTQYICRWLRPLVWLIFTCVLKSSIR